MRRLCCLALSCAFSLISVAAHAATTTYNISFTASGQVAASGSFTLTFDRTQPYVSNATAGLTVNSLSFASGPSGYIYYPGVNGSLRIGGLLSGVDGVTLGTDDYSVEFDDFGPSTRFAVLFLSQLGATEFKDDVVGTVTVTQVATTPEPSSFVLLVTGLLGSGTVLRRKLS